MGFFFGRPPYSILNLLLGFDLNQGLFGLIQPMNLLAVMIQAVHFLVNFWIVRIPFLFITGLKERINNSSKMILLPADDLYQCK
jgi:hypothetical protein